MRVADTLRGVRRLFLDTAPVAYFLERHPLYQSVVTPVFRAIDQGTPVGITSPISLAECLVLPYRLGNAAVAQVFLAFFPHRPKREPCIDRRECWPGCG